ncbi:S9 family peptidase [Sphingomonas sp. MG17]|uniref:S9 family peptidase n=1 Tax=Sphingomonas tagetis TaxID=2949092 RepID=A0A9X2KLV9_9SPHN|nr:S9 family peptidase [Sphingomonas tagetis]MCP3731934.1 S9 family peptidase [Sphingomonas tagetis]
MLRVLGLGVVAAALGGAAPPQTVPATPARLPVEAFAELPRIDDPVLSPDGQRFAAKISGDGKQFLAITTMDGGKPRLIATGDVDLNWWRWVNDEWLVLGIGEEIQVQGEPWYVSRALGVNVTTGKYQQIVGRDAAQNADDVIWTARDGSARVMIAYQTSIYSNEIGFWPKVDEIDLATGKRRTVQGPRAGVHDWYADGDGVVRMGIGISEDGRSRRLLYRPGADTAFRVVDRAKRNESRLTVPAMFLRDKTKALVIEDDEGGYSALYELDLATLEPGKQLFASKGHDIAGLVRGGDGFSYLGVRVEEERPEIRWTDPEMAAMQTAVSGLVKGARVEIASLSRDRSRAILRVGGADAPGAWFLYTPSDNVLRLIAENSDAIGMRRLHPVRTIRYKARDGLEIAAVLTLPRGKKDKLPLIVMPHGGPFARDSETWDWWTQFMADRGYAVVQPNYRGSSGYGTPFTKKGEGQWGLAMQDDLNDAVKALADLGIADPARVCMVGASYGGYAAMRAAQRDGAKYRCAVSYAGVSDLNRMLGHQRNFLFSGSRTDWLREQAPDLKGVSPVNFPEDVSIPLLLMHGEKDRVVPIVQSRVLAQKLKAASKDVTYVVQKEGDHHFSRAEDRLEFLKALEAFLAKHNPA